MIRGCVEGSVFMGQNADGTFTEIRQLVARDVDVNNKLKIYYCHL